LLAAQVKDIIILCRHAHRPEGPALASQLTRHLDLFLGTLLATVFALAMGADAFAGTLLATVYALAMGADAFAGTLLAIKCALAMGADPPGGGERRHHA
jgi:hypothetical protein